MNTTAAAHRDELQRRIAEFPSLPSFSSRLLSRIGDPDLDMGILAQEMRFDPGITANVLRLANSAYFGGGNIDSLQMAIVRLGLNRVAQLVTASSVSGLVSPALRGYDLPGDELLRHSVWVAIASESLGLELEVKAQQMLFTAGLLHDIGKVVLSELVHDEWTQFRVAVEEEHSVESFQTLERRFLGMDHAEAGALLLKQWKFPVAIVDSIRWHHEPGSADDMRGGAGLLHLADMLGYCGGIGLGAEGLHYSVSREVVDAMHIRPANLERVASRTLEQMQELHDLLQDSKDSEPVTDRE